MVALKQLDPTGVTITDEIVKCNQAITVNGTQLYQGYLNNTCNENIQGIDSLNFGVYDQLLKAGNRKNVLIAGYPVDSSHVSIDCRNGLVFSTTNTTLYVTYLAHEPIKHNINNTTIHIPYQLTAGSSITLATIKRSFFHKYGYVTFDTQGGLPSANATIVLSNGTESVNVTYSATVNPNIVELSAPLKVTSAETLTISTADGKDSFDTTISLLDV